MMDKIEFKNGSIIESIKSNNNVRSKRGNEQLKSMRSAWDLIDDYYNSLSWYKKIITKIRWFFDDIYVWLLCIYYKNKKVNDDK